MAGPALNDRKIWLDGRLVPWSDATVHVLSQSIQRGTLVFDVMACYPSAEGTAILGFHEHVERFGRSAELNGMDLPLDLAGIREAIGETVRANPGAQVVKISAYYPGFSLDVLPADTHPAIAIAAFALVDVLGGEAPAAGEPLMVRPARLQIARLVKAPPRVISPKLKVAAGYTTAAAAKAHARRDRFDDILFLDETGNVAESSTQSLLLVKGDTLFAPPLEYVLEGVTRRAVLEFAEDESIPIRIEPIPRTLLDEADEAFLAGTTLNVWAVERIEERKFLAAVPGPVTQRLIDRFDRMIAGQDPVFGRRWLQPV